MLNVQQFKQKPATIRAVLWDGSHEQAGYILEWISDTDDTIRAHFKETNETPHKKHPEIRLHTHKGTRFLAPGDWLVHGIDGDFQPCKAALFEQSYDLIT